MPSTSAPRPAIDSARMPPPQPMSTTRRPRKGASRSIQASLSGLIWCSGLNSDSGSHQREASAENLASSAGSALAGVACSGCAVSAVTNRILDDEKKPRRSGVSPEGPAGADPWPESATRTGADHLDFHATVLRAAIAGLVVGDRLLLAFAFRVDTVRFVALADVVVAT